MYGINHQNEKDKHVLIIPMFKFCIIEWTQLTIFPLMTPLWGVSVGFTWLRGYKTFHAQLNCQSMKLNLLIKVKNAKDC